MATYSDPFGPFELDRNSVSIRSFTQLGKRSCPIMASEYSILTDIAADLGMYRLNRETSPKSILENIPKEREPPRTVHEEAELLMNFKTTMSPVPSGVNRILKRSKFLNATDESTINLHSTSDRQPSTISPSFSFEAKKTNEEGPFPIDSKKSRSITSFPTSKLQPIFHPMRCATTKDTFTLNCPSLSLTDGDYAVPVDSHAHTPTNSTPSYLFSRPIKTQPIKMFSNDLNNIADTLATNVLESFNTAMNWQTKTWIKALSRVLSVKYDLRRRKVSRKKGSKRSEVNAIKEELKKSNEARVINSLVKASGTVCIHDIRTTFSVLEQQLNAQDDSAGEAKTSFGDFPAMKRRRQVSADSSEGSMVGTPYSLSHAIILETRCSVSTSPMKRMSITFRTPGAMNGTFVRDRHGHAELQQVDISLDTDAFSKSIDENCRRVMRLASEECMVNPPLHYCTIYDTVQQQTMVTEKTSGDNSHSTPEPDEDTNSQRYYSDRRYEAYFSPTTEPESSFALVTPTIQTPSVEATMSFKMPSGGLPPLERTMTTKKPTFLNPRRVSPTEQCNGSGPFDSPTPTKDTVLPNSKKFAKTELLAPPPLVSPYIPQRNEFDAGNAPTMPALLEVASAAHAKCH
jgi:hypothetical protein